MALTSHVRTNLPCVGGRNENDTTLCEGSVECARCHFMNIIARLVLPISSQDVLALQSIEHYMYSELMPEISGSGDFLSTGYVPYHLIIYSGDELIDWYRLTDNGESREVANNVYYAEFYINYRRERYLVVLTLQYIRIN